MTILVLETKQSVNTLGKWLSACMTSPDKYQWNQTSLQTLSWLSLLRASMQFHKLCFKMKFHVDKNHVHSEDATYLALSSEQFYALKYIYIWYWLPDSDSLPNSACGWQGPCGLDLSIPGLRLLGEVLPVLCPRDERTLHRPTGGHGARSVAASRPRWGHFSAIMLMQFVFMQYLKSPP